MFTPLGRSWLAATCCCILLGACASNSSPSGGTDSAASATSKPSTVSTTTSTDGGSGSDLGGLTGVLSYEVVATYPHDPEAFTQGLEIVGDTFVESTGRYGESDRRIVDIQSGEVLDLAPLADEVFGEGLTVVRDEIYQLTWQSGSVFVSDLATLDQTRELTLDRQGWGLCFDGTHLVTSDGSSTLSIRDTATLRTQSTRTVTLNGSEQAALNELECVDGYVLANVYQTASIVLIDQATGTVTGTLDLSALVPEIVGDPANDVLNGIAFRADTNTFFVTGKRWDTIYEISLSPS